ncbi:MFS transporter [Subtercola frigoramans]|uniref:CP family cyanate transporter-like MFS transporter n=1 Tax=Subtercola frigoramans TaxID=120298 RepID=A0ABS2L4H1_9MICO|nr:MFS transporter [Subtercola frigoramans]MBM7471990.1 CP family cyanate transporter-like MFS transporter [Subtercola frigoramans]
MTGPGADSVPRQPSSPPPRLSLWAGRSLALVGIILVAANLRAAVAALSPIYADISADIPLSSLGIGVLGTLTPVCFALFGILTPLFQRHLRIESLLVIGLVATIVGTLVRMLSPSYAVLVVGSVIVFAGMGVANVLLPPLVKKYFLDRLGLVTALYSTTLAISAMIPALVVVQLSAEAGWRSAVGVWGVLAIAALVPWIIMYFRDVRQNPDVRPVEGVIAVAPPGVAGRVRHSRVAWALGILFGLTALNVYAAFAWMPQILLSIAGVDEAQAGVLLALYVAMGIPASLLIPVLAARLKNVGLLIWLGAGFYATGYLGLLLAPTVAPWLWMILAGLGPLLFPLSLLLINLRTRTQEGAVALSGFAQGLGYLIGASGPLLVGVLHQVSGQWTGSLVFLLCTAGAVVIVGSIVAKPHFLEDDWHKGVRAR